MYVEGLEITYGNGDIILNGRAPVEGNFPTPILTYDENELPENVAFFVEYDGATGTAWKTAIDLDTGEQIGTSPVNDDLTTMPGQVIDTKAQMTKMSYSLLTKIIDFRSQILAVSHTARWLRLSHILRMGMEIGKYYMALEF